MPSWVRLTGRCVPIREQIAAQVRVNPSGSLYDLLARMGKRAPTFRADRLVENAELAALNSGNAFHATTLNID